MKLKMKTKKGDFANHSPLKRAVPATGLKRERITKSDALNTVKKKIT